MPRFSERQGYKEVRQTIQVKSVDDTLKNGLWNLVSTGLFDEVSGFLSSSLNVRALFLCRALWMSYFKRPIDEIDDYWPHTYKYLRKYFFECEWFEVYDFLEFVVQHYQFKGDGEAQFADLVNTVLERELSAYRLIKGEFAQITSEQEITAIEEAIENTSSPVAAHLQRALELLSDRTAPDYRNSIKESISAVESIASRITKSKGTLGQLIKKLNDETDLHPALQSAFSSLYGYTSDEGGVRHALMEAQRVDFHDAKFMLVICSAFIGFIEGKDSKSIKQKR